MKRSIEQLGASETVFSTSLARRIGIPRDALSYATKSGHLERTSYGTYRLASQLDDGLDEVRAAYTATAPGLFSSERRGGSFDGVAICGSAAAHVLEIGDFHLRPIHVAVPKRFNSRRKGIKYVVSKVTAEEIIYVKNLPVTRIERTIADLISAGEDESLIADALVDAIQRFGSTMIDIRKLQSLLGKRTLEKLLSISGIDGTTAKLVQLDELGHGAIMWQNQ